MRKKGSKQSKVSRIDRSKALAAQADEAIKERIRTAPAYMYTSLRSPGTGHRLVYMYGGAVRMRSLMASSA